MMKWFAWFGGAVFVASLASCAWFYFVRLGDDVPRAGVTPLAVDMGLVTIFACHHSILAREGIRRRMAVIPAHLRRSVYVWSASLLLVAVCAFWQPIGGEVYRVSGPASLVNVAIQVAGLALIARSVAGLDPLELAGIRQASNNPTREVLQVAGPYRLVRHPLYLGWMLTLFGAAHMTGDRLAFAGLTSLYAVIAVPFEERSLLQSFGKDYAIYQRRVRWRIVPFVY